MAKRTSPHLTAWEWFCTWARQQGVEPDSLEISDVAEYLVTNLERKRASGNPLPAAMVQLAALLVKIAGELEIEGVEPTWAAAHSRIELAFARRRAAALDILRDQAPLPRAKPEIGEPDEPPEEASVTIFDMVRTFQQVLAKARNSQIPPE